MPVSLYTSAWAFSWWHNSYQASCACGRSCEKVLPGASAIPWVVSRKTSSNNWLAAASSVTHSESLSDATAAISAGCCWQHWTVTHMPEMLDKALFRRFDEVMVYPLPEKVDIIGIIKNSLQGFSFDK